VFVLTLNLSFSFHFRGATAHASFSFIPHSLRGSFVIKPIGDSVHFRIVRISVSSGVQRSLTLIRA